MDQIDYRKVREEDYERLEELIRKTWGSKNKYPEKIERARRKASLYHYLSEQNYSCVAVRAGEVVGVLLGRSERLPYYKNKLRYLFPLLVNRAKLALSRLGRRFYEFLRQNSSESLYLFTDTACNFGFYQRKGYRRIAEKRVHYHTPKGITSEDHFLYITNLPQCS